MKEDVRKKKKDWNEDKSGSNRLFVCALAGVRKPTKRSRAVFHGRMHSDQLHDRLNRNANNLQKKIIPLTFEKGSLLYSNAIKQLHNPQASQKHFFKRQVSHLANREVNNLENEEEWPHDLYLEKMSVCAGSKVFVRNLPSSVTEEELCDLFKKFGPIVSVKVDYGPLPTAKISFLKRYSATNAVHSLMKYNMKGKLLKICVLDSEKDKTVSKDHLIQPCNFQHIRPQQPIKLHSDVPRLSVFDRLL
jgi:RNA recognition motif-containing protein